MRNRLMVASLVALAVSAVFFSVSAQQATRMFGTLSADLATGKSTPVTCTQSGNGCFLDVSIAGGGGTFTGPVLLPDGSIGSPSLAFSGKTDLGIYRATNQAWFTSGSTQVGGWDNQSLIVGVTNRLFGTAPTISSGFGTSPSIVAGSTAFSMRVNVGTGGAATSGVIGLPTALNGWNCTVQDMTNNTATRQTASTTNTATFTAAAAWAASDILVASCIAF